MPITTINGKAADHLWRVNTPQLLKEVAQFTKEGAALRQPLQILANILSEVGERAIEINDPKLNQLMCRLAIYSIADPYSPDYDKKLTNEILKKKL